MRQDIEPVISRAPRILFIDDEKLARELFASMLRERGFHVDVAEDSHIALDLVRQHSYAVVATDLRMPHLNGLALIGMIRPKLPDATYLLVTGATAPHLTEEGSRARIVDGVISKPWTADSLHSVVRRALELHSERAGGKRRALSREETGKNALLLVGDGSDQRGVSKQLSEAAGNTYSVVHVRELSEALSLLCRREFRVAVIDQSAPDAQTLDTISQMHTAANHIPIIVMSGKVDEPFALAALKAGAQDYLVKGQVDDHTLNRSIRYAIERKHSQQSLSFLAHYDQLTGLANRLLFHEKLARAISLAGCKKSRVALMILGLDRFKSINDSMGHDIGDLLLEEVARRLRANVREGDTVARLSGDEFTVLLEDVRSEKQVTGTARRILDSLARSFHLKGLEVIVTGSMGVAFYPDNGEASGGLLKSADMALCRAKEKGRNNYQLFSQESHQKHILRVQMETELQRALELEEFVIHYQPQWTVADRALIGVEALMRWQHPEMGLVSPNQFIPLLEETGLILPVGKWLIRKACAQARNWQEAGFPSLRMAANLSARQFEDRNLVETVRQALKEASLSPENLELEITESSLLKATERTKALLTELKALGVRIAMDDFGTGYSSLAYLKQFPIDTLKIDRSFIKDITTDPADATLSAAIIWIGHKFRMLVIAEGVETEEQLEMLSGCDGFQGYLYSRPLPPDELLEKLRAI